MTRRTNDFLQEKFSLSHAFGAAADADRTDKIDKMSYRGRVTRCKVIIPAGLAEHAANFATLSLMNGATVVGSISTDSAGAGTNTIVADTFTDLTLSATDANRVFAAGDVLSWKIDEEGTTTVPAGRVVVEGVYF